MAKTEEITQVGPNDVVRRFSTWTPFRQNIFNSDGECIPDDDGLTTVSGTVYHMNFELRGDGRLYVDINPDAYDGFEYAVEPDYSLFVSSPSANGRNIGSWTPAARYIEQYGNLPGPSTINGLISNPEADFGSISFETCLMRGLERANDPEQELQNAAIARRLFDAVRLLITPVKPEIILTNDSNYSKMIKDPYVW